MKITAIKAQVKNENRVSVYVDGEYSFSLTIDQLLLEKLKKDLELDEAQLQRYKKLSEEGKLRTRTLEWLLRRPHSEKELRDYLYKKKAEKELIEVITNEFREKGYVNDEQFARWFAENRFRKHKSLRSVSAELFNKGIARETIQNIVKELDSEQQEGESIEILVNKLRKRTRYQDDTKLIRYLLTKGFSYSDIKKAL